MLGQPSTHREQAHSCAWGQVRLAHQQTSQEHAIMAGPADHHGMAAKAAEPSSQHLTSAASQTAREGPSRYPSWWGRPLEATRRLVNPDPPDEEVALAQAPPNTYPGLDAWAADLATCPAPPPSTVVRDMGARSRTPCRRSAGPCHRARSRLPPQLGGRRPGDLDDAGVLHGRCASTPTSARHAPHHAVRQGRGPVQEPTVRDPSSPTFSPLLAHDELVVEQDVGVGRREIWTHLSVGSASAER